MYISFFFITGQWTTAHQFTSLLEHVLLFLGHHFPLLAAQHHPLRARDVLHVDHQLGAVKRISIPAEQNLITVSAGKVSAVSRSCNYKGSGTGNVLFTKILFP